MSNDDGKLHPLNPLECLKVSELNYWLSQFDVKAC